MTIRKRRSGERERAVAAKLQADRSAAAKWEDTAVEAEVQSQRAVITSLRLPVGEFVALQRAAKAAGQSVSEYIRNAISLVLHGGVAVNAVRVTMSSSEARSHTIVRFSALASEGASTQNPGPDRTETVPLYANLSL
jgi:hypothetical protein